MAFNAEVPASSDNAAAFLAQLLLNDKINQQVDNNAVLNSGIIRGNVVKYSSALGKWFLNDGTVAPGSTDTIGIVEMASGTSGQVKSGGIYLDASLTSSSPYYCQADGTMGTTVTKLFMGRITSAGVFIISSGLGAASPIASASTAGIVKVGSNIAVSEDGTISVAAIQNTTITTGTVSGDSGTIPLPSGYTREQCHYMVSMNYFEEITYLGRTIFTCSVATATGVVTCYTSWYSSSDNKWSQTHRTANYICVAIK